jgi:hypothetical protein
MSIDPNPYAPPKANVTDRDVPGRLSTAGRVIACVDGVMALTMAAGGLDIPLQNPHILYKAGVIALGYCAPNMLLFGLASLGMWRRWKSRWSVQGVAFFWSILPIVALFAGWRPWPPIPF